MVVDWTEVAGASKGHFWLEMCVSERTTTSLTFGCRIKCDQRSNWGSRTLTISCNWTEQNGTINAMQHEGGSTYYSNELWFTFTGLNEDSRYSATATYPIQATLNDVWEDTWSGDVWTQTDVPYYWNNINIIDPNGNENWDIFQFDLSLSDGSSWTAIANEPEASAFTKKKGTVATISNIRAKSGGTGMELTNVEGASSIGNGQYRWTFTEQDHIVSLKIKWSAFWNDINAYEPDDSTQNGLIFDLAVYNRSGTRVAWHPGVTNEPSAFTYEYGYKATISNIRPNGVGYHFYSCTGATDNGDGSYTWTFDTPDKVIKLYSDWNDIYGKYNSKYTPGDTYAKINGVWQRCTRIYVKYNGSWREKYG